MKKILTICLCLIILLALPACSLPSVALEDLSNFTITGQKNQVQYRTYDQKNYQNLSSDTQTLQSYSWVKTLNSEAILDFGNFGAMFMDKNSIAQIRVSNQGVYIVQIKGNGYHAVKPVSIGNHYNVLTGSRLHVVKGTGFGTEGNDSDWTDEGQVIVVDEVTERHEDMSEEDVPDGPLWVYGGRTLIVIRGQRNPRQADNTSGTNVGAGQDSNYNSGTGQSQTGSFDPNLNGSNWRARARDLYRRWRELEGQRLQLGDAEFQRRLLALLNSYTTGLTESDLANSNYDCDYMKTNSIPSGLYAISKLRTSDDMLNLAEETFSNVGGLDRIENFLIHVCDDNVVDSQERTYMQSFNQFLAG